MVKHKQTKTMKFFLTGLFPISAILLLCTTFSCRSNDTDNQLTGNNAVIKVNFAKDEYTDATSNDPLASLKPNAPLANAPIQSSEVPFGDFTLVTELKPEVSSQKSLETQAGLTPMAAATAIQRAIKFRVVVYNAAGNYVSDSTYSIDTGGAVTPDSGQEMKLDGGKSYTFIAYSYNTNVKPGENFVGTNLNTASITFSSAQDLMYYKTTMVPSGEANAKNNLNVVLTHKLSNITVVIDSTPTNGYNITNVSGATIGKSFSTATIGLATGSVTSSGASSNLAVTFPANPNTSRLQSPSFFINNANGINDGSFNVSSITVGPLTQGPMTLLNNLKIQPGVRYTLTVRLVPQDIYIDDTTSVPGQTIKTARINGIIWMRNNLGDNRANPDQPPFDQSNYYQFGRSTVVADASTQAGEIPGWNTTNAPSNAWNSGTEAAPIKTGNDPCPNGYRIPTYTEFQSLLNNTTRSNIGSTPPSDTNFDNARVYTSNRNKAVQLALPKIGSRNFSKGRLNVRGANATIWTSTAASDSTAQVNSVAITTGEYKTTGIPVRCVKI